MPSRFPKAYAAMLERLRSARTEAKLSQVFVAEALGVTQSAFSKIERGERRLDPVELNVLALLYKKPIAWFVEEPASFSRSSGV